MAKVSIPDEAVFCFSGRRCGWSWRATRAVNDLIIVILGPYHQHAFLISYMLVVQPQQW